jgi:hypothetical protein
MGLQSLHLVVRELQIQRGDRVGQVARCVGPTIGAATTGLCSQASATCAIGRLPRLRNVLRRRDDRLVLPAHALELLARTLP